MSQKRDNHERMRLLNKFSFGDLCIIEMKRYGVPNEHYTHKVIGALESNAWVDVPIQSPATETMHDHSEPVIRVICCGVCETTVYRVRVRDAVLHVPQYFPSDLIDMASSAGFDCSKLGQILAPPHGVCTAAVINLSGKVLKQARAEHARHKNFHAVDGLSPAQSQAKVRMLQFCVDMLNKVHAIDKEGITARDDLIFELMGAIRHIVLMTYQVSDVDVVTRKPRLRVIGGSDVDGDRSDMDAAQAADAIARDLKAGSDEAIDDGIRHDARQFMQAVQAETRQSNPDADDIRMAQACKGKLCEGCPPPDEVNATTRCSECPHAHSAKPITEQHT
jgi:hypothetical protein